MNNSIIFIIHELVNYIFRNSYMINVSTQRVALCICKYFIFGNLHSCIYMLEHIFMYLFLD